MHDKDFYLTEFDIPELKKEEVKVQKQLDKKTVTISKNMSSLSSKRVLPKEVMERYEKVLGWIRQKSF